MTTSSGPLSFDAIINDVNYKSQLDAMERRMLGFTSSTVRETGKIDQQFARLGQLAAGYFSFQTLSQLPAQILKVRGEFQQLEIAFTTMLRSKTAQEKLLGELVQTAATTPFNLKDIASGAKQLLAYGSSAGSVVKEIRMLGDVASGVSVPIGELIYLYGTLRTQGRAYAVDIRQFAGRGIPIYQELAKVLGVNVDKVNDFVESGKVGFKEVEQAFKNMTSNGGLFAGLMDAQSKSLLGLKERLGDAWDLMLNEIGKKNQDIAASLLTTTTEVVEHYEDVIDILKVAAATYGIYKTAVLVVSTVQRAQVFMLQSVALEQALAAASGEVLTEQQARQIVVSKLLQQAQASLNATMLANPYVLVATALAALVTAYFVFREEVQEVKSAQELLIEANKSASSGLRQQGSEVKTLIGIIQNQNVAESERIKAYDRLKSIAPEILQGLDFQKSKTADLTKEVNLYLVALEKKIRLESAQSALKSALDQDVEAAEKLKKAQDDLVKQSGKNFKMVIGTGSAQGVNTALSDSEFAQVQLEKAVAAKKKTEAVVKDIETTVSGIYSGGSKDGINAEITRLELVQTTIKDKLSPAYKQVEDQLKALTAQRDSLNKAEATGGKVQLKTVEYYDTQIKKLKEQQSVSSTSRADFAKYQTQIDQLEAQRRRITGELTKDEKKAQKDSDKVGPYGSVSYWDNIAQKAQEILEKTPKTDKSKIAQQNAILLDAQRKAEEARKAITVKSFDEELDDKRTKYALYQKFVEAYGKQAADAQFSDLIKSGQSYVDYLNSQIAQLEADKENVGLTDKQAGNLVSLLDQRDEFTGKKSAIDKFNESLQQTGRDAQSLTDYLNILKAKQAELDPNDNSDLAIKQRQAVAEQIKATEADLRETVRSYLQQIEGGEAQRLAITKKFADLRLGLEKEYANKTKDASYQAALSAINNSETQEVKEINDRATQASAAFKKLDEVILASGRKAMVQRLEVLNDYLKKEKAAINTQTYQQKLKERDDLEVAIKDDDLTRINEFGQLVNQLGEAFMQLGGTIGSAGSFISGFTANLSLVTQAFKDNMSAAEGAQLILQATVNIIGTITSASAQRKQAEEEFYRSVIAQQQQYNQLLNEQIGIQSEQEESVFVKNYEGRIRDGISQLESAQKGYQDSLKKLNEGQVKLGQENKVDWAAVGKSAASGAAIGAVAGPIGAAIGGVVGGLIGIFGSKKKEDEFGNLLAAYPQLIQKSKDGVVELNVALAQTLIDNNLLDESTKLLLQDTIAWTEQIKEAKEQIRSIISELAGQLGNTLRDNLVNAFKEGTDSAKAFGDSVSKVLEDVLSQIIFNQVFSKQFDQLQKEMEASFGAGGDGSWTDDFGRFFGKADELTKLFNDGLTSAQNTAKTFGLDIFAQTATSPTKDNPNSLQGAIKGVTEETASVVAGQLNAIRITQADTNGIIRQQLLVLSNIDRNTSVSNKYLDSIDKKLDALKSSDPLRAKGI
jgi:tape measure domain-containing protein